VGERSGYFTLPTKLLFLARAPIALEVDDVCARFVPDFVAINLQLWKSWTDSQLIGCGSYDVLQARR